MTDCASKHLTFSTQGFLRPRKKKKKKKTLSFVFFPSSFPFSPYRPKASQFYLFQSLTLVSSPAKAVQPTKFGKFTGMALKDVLSNWKAALCWTWRAGRFKESLNSVFKGIAVRSVHLLVELHNSSLCAPSFKNWNTAFPQIIQDITTHTCQM